MSSTHKETWNQYSSSWGPIADDKRRALFEQTLEPTCHYRDPLTTAVGFDELAAYMAAFQQQVPGGRFVTTYFLAHNQRSIAKWELKGADDSVLGDGVSYGEYDESGRLKTLTGFFEPPAL